jgi:regulator of nucleoside diphosphate kinase
MTKKRIVLSRREYEKLWNIIEAMRSSNRLREPYLRHLYDELQAAVVLDEGVLPAGTVTLYAEVAYTNLSTGSRHQASIVFPADQNHDKKRYSIFTPLGAALIGESEHNRTICYAPAGDIPLRIDAISHPVH